MKKKASCVVDGDGDTVVTDTNQAILLPVAGHPMTHLAEASGLFHIDVDQVARLLPLVVLDRRPLLPRSSSARAPVSPAPRARGDGELGPLWKRERSAASRCAGVEGAGD